jgi:hypothetical protein
MGETAFDVYAPYRPNFEAWRFIYTLAGNLQDFR